MASDLNTLFGIDIDDMTNPLQDDHMGYRHQNFLQNVSMQEQEDFGCQEKSVIEIQITDNEESPSTTDLVDIPENHPMWSPIEKTSTKMDPVESNSGVEYPPIQQPLQALQLPELPDLSDLDTEDVVDSGVVSYDGKEPVMEMEPPPSAVGVPVHNTHHQKRTTIGQGSYGEVLVGGVQQQPYQNYQNFQQHQQPLSVSQIESRIRNGDCRKRKSFDASVEPVVKRRKIATIKGPQVTHSLVWKDGSRFLTVPRSGGQNLEICVHARIPKKKGSSQVFYLQVVFWGKSLRTPGARWKLLTNRYSILRVLPDSSLKISDEGDKRWTKGYGFPFPMDGVKEIKTKKFPVNNILFSHNSQMKISDSSFQLTRIKIFTKTRGMNGRILQTQVNHAYVMMVRFLDVHRVEIEEVSIPVVLSKEQGSNGEEEKKKTEEEDDEEDRGKKEKKKKKKYATRDLTKEGTRKICEAMYVFDDESYSFLEVDHSESQSFPLGQRVPVPARLNESINLFVDHRFWRLLRDKDSCHNALIVGVRNSAKLYSSMNNALKNCHVIERDIKQNEIEVRHIRTLFYNCAIASPPYFQYLEQSGLKVEALQTDLAADESFFRCLANVLNARIEIYHSDLDGKRIVANELPVCLPLPADDGRILEVHLQGYDAPGEWEHSLFLPPTVLDPALNFKRKRKSEVLRGRECANNGRFEFHSVEPNLHIWLSDRFPKKRKRKANKRRKKMRNQ